LKFKRYGDRVIFVGATKGNVPDDSPLWNELCDKHGIPSFTNNDMEHNILFLE
jgi:hypothetical protein